MSPEFHDEPEIRAIGELRAGFPEFDLVHEIEVFGVRGWRALASVCDCLACDGSELVSLNARRYGDKGDVVTCRLRGLDNSHLDSAIVRIRQLPGVARVSVSHHLGARQH